MAEATTSEGEDAPEPKSGKMKLVIFAVLGLVLLAGGGGGAAWFLGFFGGKEPAAEAAAHDGGQGDGHGGDHGGAHEAADPHGAAAPAVVFVDMPDVLVNLQSGGKRVRFLKLRAALEVGSEEIAARVEGLMPRIMDSFQLYLRALTVEEVSGAGGLQRLKEELASRVNYAIEPTRVDDVLVKEMLVQ